MLNWLVNEHGIEPHILVFDKSQHTDGTFFARRLRLATHKDCYTAPPKELRQRQKIYRSPAFVDQRYDALSREQAGLPRLCTEAAVLSERARPKDPTLDP